MKKTKTPALTSPWKIGFFVSLMLVFVSIGVTYFFAQRHGVAWNMLDRNWLDRNEWLGVIKGHGFLFEVLPLLGLVAVTSMLSYLVITSAVSKYKRYLDSGLDYKNLLSSLKDLETLEDKKKIERIKNHPELKRLLLGLVQTLDERERLLTEREGAMATRVEDALKTQEKTLTDRFTHECERLATAISSGAVDVSAMQFSNPALQKIGEQAAGMTGGPVRSEPSLPGAELAQSYGDLRKTSDVLHSRLQEMVGELRVIGEGAKDIEGQLRRLGDARAAGPGGPGFESARKELQTAHSALRSLEDINANLDILSEEAKGVAISSALHAGSGEGTQDDLIRLAEEVKDVAARFKEATRRFLQVSVAMRTSVGALDTLLGERQSSAGPASSVQDALATIRSRVALWVERVVVLSDKVSNFQESYGVAVSAMPDAGSGRAPSAAASEGPVAQEPAESPEFGFETLDRTRTLFEQRGEVSEEMNSMPFGEKGLFARVISEPEGPAGAESSDKADRTESEQEGGRFGGVEDEREFQEPVEPVSDKAGASLRPERAPAEDVPPGFSPGRSGDVASAALHPAEATDARHQDEDEDVIDLYALGAVDYDPAVHG